MTEEYRSAYRGKGIGLYYMTDIQMPIGLEARSVMS